jgi:N-acetylmuramoyl-L-alanine amidase
MFCIMRLRRFLLLLPVLLGSPAVSQAAVVESAELITTAEYTRLVFAVDTSIEHKVFTLENPDRIVIDFTGTQLQGDLGTLALAGTPIAKIRSAARNNTDLRVVLDVQSRMQPRSFFVAESAEHGAQLILDLYSANTPAPAVAETTSHVASNVEAAVPETKRDIIVAISAGHGGDDPGAIGVNRLREKNVTLAISREVEAMINATPGYKAVMIRDGDYYIGLRERTELGHRHNADLYIAIHADAHTNKQAQGSTIYALSANGATSEQARLLAEKENAADLIGGVGSVSLDDKDEMLRSVLIDFSMNAKIATSLEIGDQVIHALDDVIHMRRDNVEQAAFVELKSADIPSLLIEAGYITNTRDAKNLDSPEWRRNFAGALTAAITGWFYERPPQGTWIAWQKANGGSLASTYTVRSGDSLSEIAERYRVSMAALKFANELDGTEVQIGQVLTIPGSSGGTGMSFREHTIARGETLSQIAESYAVPMARLRETNQLNSDTIHVGQVLKIPTS